MAGLDSGMAEVERRPIGTVSRERRFGVAVSLAMIVGGGWWAASELTGEATTTDVHFPLTSTTVRIDANTTDVEIRSGDVSEVKITRHSKRNAFSSEPKERYENGTLELTERCGVLAFGSCGTRYVVVVPREQNHGVRIETSSGDLRVIDVSGAVELKSSSGDLAASGIGGQLTLDTSSGDIETEAITSPSVKAHSSSGDIELRFIAVPASVDVEASSGDVRIVLPDGADAYKVDADTSSGHRDADIRTDPSSTRSIKAETSSGNLTIEYAGR
jgi:DUF4097 and DUF4098 domain-containing protein YvlB